MTTFDCHRISEGHADGDVTAERGNGTNEGIAT